MNLLRRYGLTAKVDTALSRLNYYKLARFDFGLLNGRRLSGFFSVFESLDFQSGVWNGKWFILCVTNVKLL